MKLFNITVTSGNSQNTNFTIYILFTTISDYFYFSYWFHYLLSTKSGNSWNSWNSLLQSKKSKKVHLRAALPFWTIVIWCRVTIGQNRSVAPSCRRHWHSHCTSWHAHPSLPCGHHHHWQAVRLSPASAHCHHWCDTTVALTTHVTSTSLSLSLLPSCRHGIGHLHHVIIVIMAPSLSPSCLIAIVPPWHWPLRDFNVISASSSGCWQSWCWCVVVVKVQS